MSRTTVFIVTALVAATVGASAAFAATASATAPGKIVVIVMEDQPYSKIVGNPDAPYINNHLAMTSGLTSKTSSPASNAFQAIDLTGGTETWTSFEGSMSGNCGAGSTGSVPGTSTPLYKAGHDPAYQHRGNETCKQNDVPMTSTSFDPAAFPTFSYIVPNRCDDMHALAIA